MFNSIDTDGSGKLDFEKVRVMQFEQGLKQLQLHKLVEPYNSGGSSHVSAMCSVLHFHA